jgi:cytochrome P450
MPEATLGLGLTPLVCRGALNYPGRLMAIGLTRDELKAQCKDLIFAGTDSTGHNVASMCRYLAMHPSKYVLSMVHSTITTKSNEI